MTAMAVLSERAAGLCLTLASSGAHVGNPPHFPEPQKNLRDKKLGKPHKWQQPMGRGTAPHPL